MRVAIVHDYLTQRGGAERVVLTMAKAFPDAPVHTTLYNPATTFPEFRDRDVRTTWVDRLPLLRGRHRFALPLLAQAVESMRPVADVVLCSSSGWAHGVQTRGRKIVYCHAPARWLYDRASYLGGRRDLAWAAVSVLGPALMHWDQRAAQSADRYLANSTVVRRRIRDVYGIEADVLHPPATLDAPGPERRVAGLEPGFFLCVSRLLPYKNVESIVRAFEGVADVGLVVVGVGPEEARLRALAPPGVRFLGAVRDDELRWLYANSTALVAASYEDFGLTPLEAAAFGRPAVVLRAGGFLDTVVDGETGLFFDHPEPAAIKAALLAFRTRAWDPRRLRAQARSFSEEHFVESLRAIVAEEARHLPDPGRVPRPIRARRYTPPPAFQNTSKP